MIERLLAAQRALGDGRLDTADQLFRQVADADARNAIAVVGLAEVAMARGDRGSAAELAMQALAIDPEDAAAARLAARALQPEPVPAGTPVPSPRPRDRVLAWLRRLLGRGGRSTR